MVDELLDRLRRDGELIASGEFELDRAAAREKLGEFQLADPHHYVLELVIAGHLLGADPIRVSVGTRELDITFEDVSLAPEVLEKLYENAFSKRTDAKSRGIWHLALGLTAVDALEPAEIRIESVGQAERSLLTRQDSEQTFTAVQKSSNEEAIHIHVREPARAAHVFEFFEQKANSLPEQVALRDACKHSTRAIYVDGESVSHGPTLPEHIDNEFAFETPYERGLVGLDLKGDEVVIELLQHGLAVAEHRMPATLAPAHLVVETERLTKNLSRDSFIRNEHWRHFTEHLVPAAIYGALSDFLPRFVEHIWIFGSYERWLRELSVRACYDLERMQELERQKMERVYKLGNLLDAIEEVADLTCGLKVWDPLMDRGEWRHLSLAEIRRRSAGRTLYYSRHRYVKRPEYDAVALHLPDGLPPLFNEVVDARLVELRTGTPGADGGRR